jgi:hypothetical protein
MANSTKSRKTGNSQRVLTPINIDTERGTKIWNELMDGPEEKFTAYLKRCLFGKFLKTVEPSLIRSSDFRLYAVTADTRSDIIIVDGRKVWTSGDGWSDIDENYCGRLSHDEIEGLILPSPKAKRDEGLACVLCNADINDNEKSTNLVSVMRGVKLAPAVSFQCLGNFYERQDVVLMLEKGRLVIVDFEEDKRTPLTDAQKQHHDAILKYKLLVAKTPKTKAEEPKPIKPPKPGFTIIGHGSNREWHRPGAVVIRDTKTGQCYLFGQDDETYFGCELPDQVESVSEAYNSLTPEAVHGRADWDRQGEWFALPCTPPEEKDCALIVENSRRYNLWLARKDEDGNQHCLECEELRVGKDGLVYARNGNLCHDQHGDLSFTDWVVFHENRAVRSFSQEGVD